MRWGCGYPGGPLPLLHLFARHTATELLNRWYTQPRSRLHAPAPLLKQMITAGLLGRKTGRGFYTYDAPHGHEVVPDALTPTDALPADADIREIGRAHV